MLHDDNHINGWVGCMNKFRLIFESIWCIIHNLLVFVRVRYKIFVKSVGMVYKTDISLIFFVRSSCDIMEVMVG